jgi:hypothetical protein
VTAHVATSSGGWIYGTCHILLVLALTPIFCVGPLLIPGLVIRDSERRLENQLDSQGNGDVAA